jgi:hypothetical protein
VIECGWCGQPTKPGRCGNCQRDPALPWLQRGTEPPAFGATEVHRRRLAQAYRELGRDASVERLAEFLDVDARTVRRWRAMSA